MPRDILPSDLRERLPLPGVIKWVIIGTVTNRTCLALCFTYPVNIGEAVEAIARSGFGSVEAYLDYPVGNGMIERLQDAGINVSSAHAGQQYLDEPYEDPATGDQIDVYRQFVDYCAGHSIPCLSVHPCFKYSESPDERSLRRMRDIAEYASGRGVDLAVENVGKTGHLDYLLDGVDQRSLGFLYDSGHDNVSGEEFGAVLRRWGKRLRGTHLSDNDGVQDSHSVPGRGSIDWHHLASVFDWSQYQGLFVLEAYLRKDDPLGPFLKEAHRSLSLVLDVLHAGPA